MTRRVRSGLLLGLGLLGLLAAVPVSAGWLADMRLTYNDSTSTTSNNNAWCVAASGDTLHVVWFDNRAGGVNGVYYKRSTDDGVTWSSDTLMSGSTDAWYPCVAVSHGHVHIAWEDIRDGNYEIYYTSSTDGGTTWGADQRLTVNSAQSWYPSIAASDSNLDVVWEDGRNAYYNIWEKYSTDWGSTWSDDESLSSNDFTSANPAVAISGSDIFVVWLYSYINASDIQFRRSTDLGATWDSTQTLSTTMDFPSSSPTLAVAGTQVNVVWQYTVVNPQMMYRRSTDLGVTWLADTALTSTSYSATNPSVAARDSLVHIVWQDNRDGNWEIYYKRSLHHGTKWDADTRLTNDTNASWYPSIAAGLQNLYVVWTDNRPGNYEIYFKEFYAPDVAAVGIIAPTGSVDSGQVIAPQASVRNNGTRTAIFPLEFSISDGYSNVQTCTLSAGQTRTMTFADWTADTLGSLTTRCTTRLSGDVVPGNDQCLDSVIVEPYTGSEQAGPTSPTRYELARPTPNPFSGLVGLRFALPQATHVELAVYSVTGACVRTLQDASLPPGYYRATWDGRDRFGRPVRDGIYFCRLLAGRFSAARRIVRLR